MADRDTIIEAMARAICRAKRINPDAPLLGTMQQWKAEVLAATAAYDAAYPAIREAVLDEAAETAEQFTVMQHIAQDMIAKRFPNRSDACVAIADAIRALKETP